MTKKDKEIIRGMIEKFSSARKRNPRVRIIDFPELKKFLTSDEQQFLEKFLKINPRMYGFRGKNYGMLPTPKDLVTIKKEAVPVSKRIITHGVHYLPKAVYCAYRRMNRAMLRDIGRRVFVESGYRSPAYQLMLFLEYLSEDNFAMKKTVARIAFPGYSEHGAPDHQAIDFVTREKRDNTTEDVFFGKTEEYRWLLAHAVEYGFILSYPRDNKWGVLFEPWHWRWK